MLKQLTIHQYPIRIFYEDTDAGGVVYNANYLKFCERARTEWLRELGIVQSVILENDIAFVVRKVEMDCIASAKLDDLVTIKSSITVIKRASVVFHQQVYNQHQSELCTINTLIACVNLSIAKPCAIPSNILGALKSAS
jgi:acyl-CoA thioester hydrolase